MQDKGVDRETIALYMLVAVLGGLAFQLPVGRLSDRFDRRIVLAVLGIGFAIAAVALIHLPPSLWKILPSAVLLGGFMSTLYPVCVANAHDRMPADRVVAVSGHLILVSGLGSIVGPLIGTSIMAFSGINGLFYFMAAVALLLAVVAGGKSLTTRAPLHLQRPFKILAPQAVPVAHDPVESADASLSPGSMGIG
jgi:MFS family permease